MGNRKILILPRYTEKGPSSRVRMFQYLPYLQKEGYEISLHPFFSDAYITALYSHHAINTFSVLSSYIKRINHLLWKKDFDLIWMQQEFFPWIIPGIERLFYKKNIPMIVDYDDAVFHRYDMHHNPVVRALFSSKIDRVMQMATGLTVGNAYLAEHARQAGASSIQILPSVVDTDQYSIASNKMQSEFVIGWIGTPKTVHFLEIIKPALKAILDKHTRFILVGAEVPESMCELPIESQPWKEDTEIEQIQQFDVGIMPLFDAPFERGKCGYKLIQYMACGLPVIASPVGMNVDIVDEGGNGFLASTSEEWVNAIQFLKTHPEESMRMGLEGRKKVEVNYSLKENAHLLISIFHEIIK